MGETIVQNAGNIAFIALLGCVAWFHWREWAKKQEAIGKAKLRREIRALVARLGL